MARRSTKDSQKNADKPLSAKGLRSRENIKQSALFLLSKDGFRNIRVIDVTKKAGVASGLFYRYFPDLRAVTRELCEDLFEEINEESRSVPFDLHPFDWFYQVHFIVVSRFASNPGLLACMFELPGEFAEFGEIWKAAAHKWNLQVAKFLKAVTQMPQNTARQMAFVLGAMSEGIFYQVLIRHTRDLEQIGKSPEEISEAIAVMWYRTIFFQNPPSNKIRSRNKFLKDKGPPASIEK